MRVQRDFHAVLQPWIIMIIEAAMRDQDKQRRQPAQRL